MSSTVRPALASALRLAGAGPVSMIVGSDPDSPTETMRARGVSPAAAPAASRADQHERRTVDDARGVAGVVDVLDPLDPVVALQRHGVEPAGLTDRGERRRQPGEGVQRGAGAQVLVALQDRQPVAVAHRDDRPGEPAVRPGLRGARLRLDGVGVDVRARVPVEGGDEIGADALRDEAGVVGGLRVHRPGAAVAAHRHPRHRLDAAREDQVLHPGADLHRGDVHRLEPRGAEPVELHAGDRLGQAGGQRRGPGDVAALVADRGDDTRARRRRSPPGRASGTAAAARGSGRRPARSV